MRLLIFISVLVSVSIALALGVLNAAGLPDSVEETVALLRSFEDWLWAIGMLVIAGDAFLLLPSDAAILALGLVYGPLMGGALASVASISGGMLVFAAGRALGERTAEWVLGEGELRRLQTFYARWGLHSVALARALGGPLELVPALAGFSRMSWASAFIAMCAGGIPSGFLKAALGALAAEHTLLVLLVTATLGLGGGAIAHRLVAGRDARRPAP